MHDQVTEEQLASLLSNPNTLLDEIDRELERVPMDQLPVGVLSGRKPGEPPAPPYREVRDGRPRHAVLDALLAPLHQSLYEAVCQRGDYCAFREKHGATVDLAKAICDSVLSVVVAIPLPIGTVLAYCIQSLLLDRLCKCNSGTARPQPG